jgi:hypothetical protein
MDQVCTPRPSEALRKDGSVAQERPSLYAEGAQHTGRQCNVHEAASAALPALNYIPLQLNSVQFVAQKKKRKKLSQISLPNQLGSHKSSPHAKYRTHLAMRRYPKILPILATIQTHPSCAELPEPRRIPYQVSPLPDTRM